MLQGTVMWLCDAHACRRISMHFNHDDDQRTTRAALGTRSSSLTDLASSAAENTLLGNVVEMLKLGMPVCDEIQPRTSLNFASLENSCVRTFPAGRRICRRACA